MKMPISTDVDLGPGNIVLDGDQATPPPRKGHSSPLFSPHVYCGHGCPSQQLMSSFWATVSKTVRPMLSVRCLSVCPVCLSVTLVYCGQTVGRIKMKLGMQVGLGPGHIVLDGDPATPNLKGHSPPPIFGPYLLRPNGCMDQGVTWYGGRPRPRRLCVRWGPRSPLSQRGTDPQFSAHICCCQMAARIKMSLGMELGLDLGDFVLDGDPAPTPQKGAEPPNFRPMIIGGFCGQTAGWMKLVLGMAVRLNPGDFVLDGDPVPFPQKGAKPPPQFSVHFYCGQTAACIKMPLGIELGIGPGDFVLDGNPLPLPQRGTDPPIFGPYLLRPNGCMDQDNKNFDGEFGEL